MPTDSMVDFSDAPARITIGDKEYAIPPLTMGDRFEAEQHIRDDNLNRFLRVTETKPLPADVRGTALAEIACKQVTSDQLISTSANQLYLLYLSMRRGDPKITWKFVQSLPSMTIETLSTILHSITGLVKEDDAADPTDTTSTTKSSTPIEEATAKP
ncbi:hypothetical protein LCGC14_1416190 [marine sediment metagenome]|uniref:Uncharacterized protein n=1 Tax=marine sediment metagenome TaxID=412755 RepID=A0A0F9M8A5_9ZZZZ